MKALTNLSMITLLLLCFCLFGTGRRRFPSA